MSTTEPVDQKHEALQVYTSFVDSTHRSVASRGRINAVFITLNSALLSFDHPVGESHVPHYVGFALGLVLAIVWLALVRYYSTLIEQKTRIVIGMEGNLPFQPYSELWRNRQSTPRHLRRRYIEPWLPGVFFLVYVARFVGHAWLNSGS